MFLMISSIQRFLQSTGLKSFFFISKSLVGLIGFHHLLYGKTNPGFKVLDLYVKGRTMPAFNRDKG